LSSRCPKVQANSVEIGQAVSLLLCLGLGAKANMFLNTESDIEVPIGVSATEIDVIA